MGVDDEECDTELGLGMRIRPSTPVQLDLLPLAPARLDSSSLSVFPCGKNSADRASAIPRKNFIDVNGLAPALCYSKQHGDTHNDNMGPFYKTTMSSFHVDHDNVVDQESSYGVGIKRERDSVTGDFEGDKAYCRVSDEEEEGSGTRKKLRLSKQQSATLEETFKENSTLNPKQKEALAKHLNLSPRQVEVWFQNRRARTKFKQTEVDCELLRRCYESLTEENRRLQEELIELRSLKLASTSSPLYMQMQSPSANLTVCPSCQRVMKSDNIKPFTSLQKSHFYPSYTHSSVAC
ncbi:hypothetical protein SUGI_0537190 [Cryptomeria japonica]|uniref:homeobox-leucine zipper protein HOX11 n=1 Tax=Cryptomeria japonica TaxID=3369 RepID=UPI002408C819|nr:homeobox-leucine zipper protein HOX11 [Cryptomeria japonica]GLJ27372.1 hypothetical protein SUGI_0537190 [Cryptomeria japonica]